jgi:tetratricopeptide (TPR) repeat protein
MRGLFRATVLVCCLNAVAGLGQTSAPQLQKPTDSLLKRFFLDFDLPGASAEANARLHRLPGDPVALFVRMEAAELQERPEIVLDSARRLCSLSAAPELQEIASNRILQHAANTRIFNSFLRRVKLASATSNECTFNLRLALVAAASDGNASLDLDSVARSASLLTHWRMAGAFGQYDNVDFERQWPPEADQLSQEHYSNEPTDSTEVKTHSKKGATLASERFWFRDGMITLPEYLSAPGVFYAASDLETTSGQSQIEVLGIGPYEVFIDGKSRLLHDSRFIAGPSRGSALVRLSAGHHRVLIKFTADATPFSVAVHPQFSPASSKKINTNSLLQEYLQELLAYFHGDFVGLERLLDTSTHRDSGAAAYLRAMLYSAVEEHSPRADAAWKAATTSAAFLARLKSAESAFERGQTEDVRHEILNILAERPQSETALQLAFHASRRSQLEATGLLNRLLELHPSCAWLNEAAKFYSAKAEQEKAGHIEQQLATCAPESLQFARILSESGRHGAAAAYLQQLVTKNPLHRVARRFLVEQLVLDNQLSAAQLQAKQLREISPNAHGYERLAEEPGTVQDSRSQRAGGFLQGSEFYVLYRRDGTEMVRKTAQRSFSGGAAVTLLSDRVILVQSNGLVSVYTHRITRPLNKDGITHYGEVTLPRDADLLELRTIKSSGEIIEPELEQQKPTISMPALEPGDAIDEEYVTHYAALDEMRDGSRDFTFGSFDAPIVYSRMVLLSPADDKAQIGEYAEPPQPLVGENNGTIVRIWERNNIPQTLAESFLPSTYLLPTVSVFTAEKTRDRLRDELIDATRIGMHVNEAALNMQLAPALSDTEKAKRLYRFVTTKIDSTGPDWANNPAEDTLLNGQGSRTSALLALARSSGLKADLLLARRIDQSYSKAGHELSCYTEPLVRFALKNGNTFDVDAESEDLPFATVPPSLEAGDALLVPILAEDEKKPEIVALSTRPATEKTVAEGDLSFHQGDLTASILVRLGPARAQEIRNLLRTSGESERQAFFEQLAMRIFSGATSVSGLVDHEKDLEYPLELQLRYTVPQFINPRSSAVDIDQLAPVLGLGSVYAKPVTRKFPLYIESLFFESTVFHLHLPEGMDVVTLPADFNSKSEFGDYSVRFVRLARQIDIHREFHIPVQVIVPEKYSTFASFAHQIDEVERQRISLEMIKGTTSNEVSNSLR